MDDNIARGARMVRDRNGRTTGSSNSHISHHTYHIRFVRVRVERASVLRNDVDCPGLHCLGVLERCIRGDRTVTPFLANTQSPLARV